MITFLAVGGALLFTVIAGYGIFRLYMSWKQNRVKSQPKVEKIPKEKPEKKDKK